MARDLTIRMSPATLVNVSGVESTSEIGTPTVSVTGASSLVGHWDWSTATGQSDAALNDTGKAFPWTDNIQVGSSPQILTVVSAAGRGFPAAMANVLRVEHAVTTDGWWIEVDGTISGRWSAPAVGQTQYYRVYFRHEISDAAGTQGYAATHPMETEYGFVGLGNNTIALKFGSYGNGTYPWYLQCEGASFPFSAWCPGAPTGSGGDPATLNKNTTYRFEWAITRTSSTQYTLAMRIYGADDSTLLFGNSTIYPWGGTTGQNLGVTGTGGASPQQLPMDTTHYTRLRFGKNGGFGAGAGNYVYWGGVAVSQTDWCGPYTAAG